MLAQLHASHTASLAQWQPEYYSPQAALISQDLAAFRYVCRAMLVIDGRRLDGVGVAPDITAPLDIRFSAGKDVQLERVKDEMVKLIESSG